MAYAFNRGARQQPQQKADIFATPDIGGAVASAQQPTDAQAKRTKELPGAVVASTATTTAPAAQAAPGAEQTPQQGAVKAVRAASEQQGAFPGVFQSIQGNIKAAQDALQSEANTYATRNLQGTAAPGSVDIEKAIAGGENYADIVSILNPTQKTYTGPEFKTDTAIEDAGRVQSDTGLRELLARGQGPSYSSGMSAFDVAALKKQAGFQDQLRAIKGGQQALETSKETLADTATQQRKDFETKSQEAAAAQTKAYLEAELDRIIKENEKQAILAKTMTGSKAAKKLVREELEKIKADFIAKNPELAPYADSIISGNLDQFYTVGDITPETFMSEDDLARYKGITGLLGMGGELPAASSVGGWQDLIDINEQAFTDYLQSRFGGKKTAADQAAAAAAEQKAAEEAVANAPIEFEEEKVYAKKFPKVTVPQVLPGYANVDLGDDGPTVTDFDAKQSTTLAPIQPAYNPAEGLGVDSGGSGGGGFPGIMEHLTGIAEPWGELVGSMVPNPSRPLVPPGKDILEDYQTNTSGWAWS